MKKVFFIVALTVASLVNAQTEDGFSKGSTFILGSIGYSNTTIGDNKQNIFSIDPSVGYFVSDNIAVGAKLIYSSGKIDDNNGIRNLETKVSSFGAGIFGRYYCSPKSKFTLFGQLGFDYGTQKTEQERLLGGFDEFRINTWNIGFAPGFNYFLSKNFALDGTIGVLNYGSSKADVSGAEATNNFKLSLGIDILSLGLVYKF